MTGRREICPIHHVAEDIVKETQTDNITYRQQFECGIENNIKKIPPMNETIAITDKLEAKVIRFRSLTDGPLLVSDNSGTSVVSGSFQGTLINGDVTNSTVSINYNIYYQPKFESTTNFSLQNILSMVENNNNLTREQKDKTMDRLTKIADIVKSAGSLAFVLGAYLPLLSNLPH